MKKSGKERKREEEAERKAREEELKALRKAIQSRHGGDDAEEQEQSD